MNESSKDYFAQVAKNWDSLSNGYFGPGVRSAAIAHAHLSADMEAADIGAGTGFIAAGVAPLVARMHVVDGSPEMLAEAQKNLSAFSNVQFHLAQAEKLPFADESLDVVFANMLLHHIPQPLSALREMVRVLRPGGRLVITDMDAHPYTWLKEEMADVWQGFERSQIEAWFKELDLVNRVVTCSGETCRASATHSADAGRADISVFVASATRRVSMRGQVQDHYAAAAAGEGACSCSSTADSSCCGSTQSSACCGGDSKYEQAARLGYKPQQLSSIPADAVVISLGCGNPTAFATLRPGETVVDIGSGGGLDSFIAAEKVGPQGRVIGVDMTPAMLERARATAQKNAIRNVEFRQGYAEKLPVEDNSVDVILSNCVINLAEDKGAVFNEAFRVLKPGGRLEVSDVVMAAGISPRTRANAGGWSECVNGALPEAEYLALIAQAGFTEAVSRRSLSADQLAEVPVYSAQVSARKPAAG